MKTRDEAIQYCLSFKDVYEDYPFRDANWTVIRHSKNQKVFAWIFERKSCMWINVKCDTQWRDFWRDVFESVVPAYHLNKKYWNSIILDGTVPEEDIKRMVKESYELTKGTRN